MVRVRCNESTDTKNIFIYGELVPAVGFVQMRRELCPLSKYIELAGVLANVPIP